MYHVETTNMSRETAIKQQDFVESEKKRIHSLIKSRVEHRVKDLTDEYEKYRLVGNALDGSKILDKRQELTDFYRWILSEVFASEEFEDEEVETKMTVKIWDILKHGRKGEVYRATNTIDSWNGAEIQVVTASDRPDNNILIYHKAPNVKGVRIAQGKVISLVGAVTRADWEFVGVFKERDIPKRSILLDLCLEMNILQGYIQDDHGMGKRFLVKKKADLQSTIAEALQTIQNHVGDFLASVSEEKTNMLKQLDIQPSDYYPNMGQLKVLQKELHMMKSYIHHFSDDELIEKIERVISIVHFFYMVWWNVDEWDDRLNGSLTKEDMILIGKECLKFE